MQTIIDNFCDLVGNKNITLEQVKQAIRDDNINISTTGIRNFVRVR